MNSRRIRRLAALLSALAMLSGIAGSITPPQAIAEEMEIVQDVPLELIAPEAESSEESAEAEAPAETPAPEAPEETISPERIPPTQEPALDATLPPEEQADAVPAETAPADPQAPEAPSPEPLVYTYAVRSSRDPLAEIALPIIISNEGSYSAVNANDNGALSVGKIQWHAGRALSLMRRIVALNPDQAMEILGEALYSEITDSSTKWTTRVVNGEEKALLSRLLGTAEGKAAQDDQALDDVSAYLQHGRDKGLVYEGALIYFADIENQNGAGGSGRIARQAIANAGSAGAVTLEVIHQTALADEKVGQYATRRNRTYEKIRALKLDADAPVEAEGVRIVGVKFPSTYRISPDGYTVKDGSITSDAELKSLTMDLQNSKGKSIGNLPKTWPLSGKTRSLSAYDSEIPFSKIKEPGNYIWSITVEDSRGRSVTLRLPICAVTSGSSAISTASSGESVPAIKVSSIELSKSSLSLEKGESATLSARILPESAANQALVWSSSDERVATVSGGHVRAVGVGSTEIICRSGDGGTSAVCRVEVRFLPQDMEILVPEGYLALGESVGLEVKFSPAGSSAALKWSSANAKIAAVDENGVVTGVKLGSTTLTVRSENGLKDSIRVRVVDPKVALSVQIEGENSILLNMGETVQLSAVLQPVTAETQIKWTSSNSKYVKVQQDGSIYGARVGSASVSVLTRNGKKDTVKVKVVDPGKPSSVALDRGGTVELAIGESLQLSAAVQPATAEAKLEWSSSSAARAKVDQSGLVTARKEGTATITVLTQNGKKDTVKIKVIDPSKPTAVELNASSTVTIEVGEELQLRARLLPEGAQAPLRWRSKNSRCAKVDQNGLVTGLRKGSTTIAVDTQNGCMDTVKIKVV